MPGQGVAPPADTLPDTVVEEPADGDLRVRVAAKKAAPKRPTDPLTPEEIARSKAPESFWDGAVACGAVPEAVKAEIFVSPLVTAQTKMVASKEENFHRAETMDQNTHPPGLAPAAAPSEPPEGEDGETAAGDEDAEDEDAGEDEAAEEEENEVPDVGMMENVEEEQEGRKKRRPKTAAEKAAHAAYMKFSRSLQRSLSASNSVVSRPWCWARTAHPRSVELEGQPKGVPWHELHNLI